MVEGIPLGGTIVRSMMKAALGKEIDKVVLQNGDAYCAWLYLQSIPRRLDRTELSRLDFIDRGGAARCTGMGFCVDKDDRRRMDGRFLLHVYDNGAKVGEAPAKNCTDHTRCWSGRAPGSRSATSGSTGFAGCLELKLQDGRQASILVAQGKLPAKIQPTQGALQVGVDCSKRL